MTKSDLKKNPLIVYHYIVECIKYAYGQRPLLADLDFSDVSAIVILFFNLLF